MFRFNRVMPPGVLRLGVVLLIACATAGVAPALAGWPLESAARVTLGYGETYTRDGRSVSHLGVDLDAEAGSSVLAPASGVVSFVGRVPGSAGTMLALTITADDGMLVTVSPLSSAQAGAGERVEAGGLVGQIAESGDPSTPTPHLHVSARRGDRYLDPTALLGESPAATLVTLPNEEVPEVPAVPITQVLPQVEAAREAVPEARIQVEPVGVSPAVAPQVFAQAESPVPASVGKVAPAVSTGASEVAAREAATTSLQLSDDPMAARLHASNVRPQEFRAAHGSGWAPGSFTRRREGKTTGAVGLLAVGALAMWPLWRRRRSCGPDVSGQFHHVATAVAR
ncbi:MAG: peptidoglycan DD-metalloendopeptidase family protein [Actinobacteria bacterium]|nr:peptidoglycan DD-metalloendopeptidase family protein [Actinomycetota bacterium]MCG2806930.1 peptidoglycan DD-metalloendopeptidase family protein [Coriobacteriia bacterium]